MKKNMTMSQEKRKKREAGQDVEVRVVVASLRCPFERRNGPVGPWPSEVHTQAHLLLCVCICIRASPSTSFIFLLLSFTAAAAASTSWLLHPRLQHDHHLILFSPDILAPPWLLPPALRPRCARPALRIDREPVAPRDREAA